MPRYKYAIGNAPVRFPSLQSQSSIKEEEQSVTGKGQPGSDHGPRMSPSLSAVQDDGLQAHGNARPNRWSLLSLVGGETKAADGQVKRTRSQQDLRKSSGSSSLASGDPIGRSSSAEPGEAERQRSASMFSNPEAVTLPAHARVKKAQGGLSPGPRSSLYSPRIDGEQRQSKRVSWIMPVDDNTSRSNSRASSVHSGVESATEQTGLLRGQNREMAQRQHDHRPPSPSVLAAPIRPSSLFWTEIGARHQSDGKKGETVTQNAENGQAPSPPPRSYGAISSASIEQATTPNEEDPYGYRAMAGPALLPTFHERQQNREAAKSSMLATRTCSTSSWLALVGLSVLVIGLVYFLIL